MSKVALNGNINLSSDYSKIIIKILNNRNTISESKLMYYFFRDLEKVESDNEYSEEFFDNALKNLLKLNIINEIEDNDKKHYKLNQEIEKSTKLNRKETETKSEILMNWFCSIYSNNLNNALLTVQKEIKEKLEKLGFKNPVITKTKQDEIHSFEILTQLDESKNSIIKFDNYNILIKTWVKLDSLPKFRNFIHPPTIDSIRNINLRNSNEKLLILSPNTTLSFLIYKTLNELLEKNSLGYLVIDFIEFEPY